MLKIKNINAYYGKVHALKNVSLHLNRGEIVTLIGANGAGKTTLLRAVSGMLRRRGSIRFDGRSIDNMATEDIARLGVAHVPDGRGTFLDLTAEENLRIGAYTRKDRGAVARDMERVFTYFPRLKERRHQQAGTLSGGEQQMLAMGRALMSNPTLLMLDEPSMGLAPVVVETIFEIIQKLNKQGITILLVEQNANLALAVANRGYVLETGKISLTGSGRELLTNEAVRKAYLGEG